MKRTASLVAAMVTLAAGTVVGVGTATAEPGRTEIPYSSTAPLADRVIGSVVSVPAPLPEEAGPRPARCDRLSYLRWRSTEGPKKSAAADRIFVAQPGIFEGAGAFESVARNTVVAAAERGVHVEFWALDRRSNCLEDHTGVQAALTSGDFDTATDYYFNGTAIDGNRFAGYATGDDVAWLGHMGLEQTLRDQYDLLRHELPDPQVRKDKVLCGGHSLGGFITGYFAEWDFDGNADTTDDAGYNQCSGYFALDTIIAATSPSPVGGTFPELPRMIGGPLDAASGAMLVGTPVLALPAVINPETTSLLALAGLAARLDPDGLNALVERIPRNTNVDWTLRTLLAGDYTAFTTGTPDVRTLNATNEALLGVLLDDNSQPLGFLQASVGFLTGGPVEDKTFPVAHGPEALSSGMFGDALKAAPLLLGGDTVYRWLDYDEVDSEDSLPDEARYTSAAAEITSIAELARNLSEPPLDFTEWYFPTRLPMDLAMKTSPSFARHHLHRDGVSRNPVVTLVGSGGIALPESPNPEDEKIVLDGYNHIDLLTAAWNRRDGRPEPVSQALAEFAAREPVAQAGDEKIDE